MGIAVYPSPTYLRRETYAALDSHGRIYLHGAVMDATQHFISGVSNAERYDPLTGTWTVLANPPHRLYQYAFVLDNSDRYVASGSIVTGLDVPPTAVSPFHETHIYDPSTDSWTVPSANGPTPGGAGTNGGIYVPAWRYQGNLYFCDPVSNDRKMHSFDGSTYSTGTNTAPISIPVSGGNDILDSHGQWFTNPIDASGLFLFALASTSSGALRYNPATDTWSQTAVSPINVSLSPTIRNGWDGSRYLYHLSPTAFVRYDSLLDSWSTLASLPAFTITQPGDLVADGTYVAMLGYRESTFVFHPNIWLYTIATNTWVDSGDALSVVRHPAVLKDPSGSGYFLTCGQEFSVAGNPTNVFEYWVPNGTAPPALTARSRHFAQIFGD